MLKEIRSEIIYVITLLIIITWGIVLADIQHRWRTYSCEWEYVCEPVDAWAVAATTGGK